MGSAEESRKKILEAALEEFSVYGFSGARVDRIASKSGCGKNLIYVYFRNKDTLFTTLLERQLARVVEELPWTPDDLPGYAVRLFDFAFAHPALMRLLAWNGLERRSDGLSERMAAAQIRVADLARRQEGASIGSSLDPSFLLATMTTLATQWTAADPFGNIVLPDLVKHPNRLRKNIAAVVRLLVDPQN